MKKIGEYTVRGMLEDNEHQRISLFDGSFSTGYRIVDFKVVGENPRDATSDVYGICSTEERSGTLNVRFDNNIEIAWASSSTNGYGPFGIPSIIDPDNLIIEDLFIYGNNALSSGDNGVNYIIYLEKYDITDWQGALAMVRNSSQNV